jgi:hypothetical protein
MAGALDSAYSAPVPPDQQPTVQKAAAAASQKTSDTFVLEKSGLNVVASGGYAFSFAYKYLNPNNPSDFILGPRSANFRFTLEAPDYTVAAQNVVVTPGALSYIVKWDAIDKSLSANKWFIDAQIYESTTGAFAGEEYLVWNGTGNTATILVSNTNNRWIRVDTRDQDYHKKSVVKGPFNAIDPIVVDTTGPANVTSVSVQSGIDTSGYLGFNAYADVTWPSVTGGGIRGYRIRFSNDNNTTYSYVNSPGTGTTYRLGGLAIGATYKIAVATYDEYDNTSSAYVSASDVTVTGTPAVTSFIKGGPFEFGVGVGSVSTNKGLYFDASNYWYVNASNSARLKVGGSTSNYLLWDGSTFSVDGSITARGGTFSGNIFMSTTGASIYNGTVNTAGNLTGDGFALNSSGLKVAKGTNSITLDAANGTITANAGTIAGWTLGSTTLSKNNVILDSAGQIQVGATAATSVYIKSSGSYVMWAGNNTPDANAKFRVGSDGTLYANGAVFGTGTTVTGYATSTQLSTTNTNVTSLNTTVTSQGTTLATKLTKSTATITDSSNNITAINAAGITVFSNGSGTATSPGSGARIIMNSAGIAAYDSSGTNATFSIDATSGTAVFKGTVYAAAGEFTGKVTANNGSIGGWTIGTDSLYNSSGAFLRANGNFVGNDISGSSLYSSGAIDAATSISAGTSLQAAGSVTFGSNAGLFEFLSTSGNVRVGATYSQVASGRSMQITSAGLYGTTASTERKKHNIMPYQIDQDALLQLEPVSFNYLESIDEEQNPEYGFIAEDADRLGLYPLVGYDKDGIPDYFAYEKLPIFLLQLIQNQKTEIDSLKNRLDALEG